MRRVDPSAFGQHSLDTAITVAKRLQTDLHADLIEVDTDADSTTLYLSIPPEGVSSLHRIRRKLWTEFVAERTRRRRELAEQLHVRVTQQRQATVRNRLQVGRVREHVRAAGRA